MSVRLVQGLLLTLALVSLQACGSNNRLLGKHSSGAAGDDNSPGTYDQLGLSGTYANACTSPKDGGSYQTRYVIAQNAATRTLTYYGTANCRSGDEQTVYTEVFANAQAVTPSDLDGYSTIRSTITTYTCVLNTAGEANLFSTKQVFGYTDWQQGQAKDITGRKYSDKDTANPVLGDTRYYTLNRTGNTLSFAVYDSNNQAQKSTDPSEQYTLQQ
jgi:hypothetical protein